MWCATRSIGWRMITPFPILDMTVFGPGLVFSPLCLGTLPGREARLMSMHRCPVTMDDQIYSFAHVAYQFCVIFMTP